MIQLRAFQFYHHFTIHEQVQALVLDHDSLIKHIHFFLPNEWDALQGEFVAEGFFVDRFKKARTQMPMNFNGGTNDAFRDRI